MSESLCGCYDLGLVPNMSYEDIVTKVIRTSGGCCAPRWICPTLDRELRRAEAEHERKNQYYKRLKQQGHSDADIKKRQQRRRGKKPASIDTVIKFDFEPTQRRKVKVA